MKNFYLLLILTGVIIWSCEREPTDYSYSKNNDVRSLVRFININPASIPADNASSTIISVQIAPETDSVYRKVLFVADKGTFSNANDSIWVNANYNGQCSARLISSTQIGIARINAIVKDIVIDTTMYFTTAFPEDFLLSTSNYVIDSGEPAFIKAELYRRFGNVSNNLKVSFFLKSNDTIKVSPIISQYGVVNNDTVRGEIINPFYAQGLFTFIAKVLISSNDTLEKEIEILFK